MHVLDSKCALNRKGLDFEGGAELHACTEGAKMTTYTAYKSGQQNCIGGLLPGRALSFLHLHEC